MAYRFKLKEELRAGVRRMAVEQLEKSLSAPPPECDRVQWVHETRKALKRTRALLRSVRDGLDSETWRAENGALRAIARSLSPMRDRDVMEQTLALLATSEVRRSDKHLDAALTWYAGVLTKGNRRAKIATEAPEVIIGEALEALGQARDRLSKLEVTGDLGAVLAGGIASTLRTGQETLSKLEADPSDETIHELRKDVQTYQRQHGLLLAAWPELQATRVAAAKALAEILGEAQDLSVLAAAIKSRRVTGDQKEHARRILVACRERQDSLREIAMPMASRLFALKPKAAGEEIARCWQASIALATQGLYKAARDEAAPPAVRRSTG
jgi:CHAD domain-containing protein